MASNMTMFPKMGEITMRKKDAVLPGYRNNFNFDEATLLAGQRRNQVYYPSRIKAQYTDKKTIYFFTTAYYTGGGADVYLAIVDKDGNAILAKDPTVHTSEFKTAVYTYKSGDIEEDTDVLAFSWRFTAGSYPEGDYYVYVKVTYNDASIDEFISEPIWVKEKHKDTERIDYTHPEDAHQILFDTLDISFNKRIDTNWLRLVPKGVETTYEEQDEELRKIYGQYYRAFSLNLKRVPEYDADKLYAIFYNCLNFRIGDRMYLRDSSQDITYERPINSSIGKGELLLRQYYQDRDGLFLNGSFVVANLPSTFPYIMPGFKVGNLIETGTQDIIEIYDAGEEAALVTALNNGMVVDDLDSDGSFSVVGRQLIFQNGPGESFFVYYTLPCESTHIEVDLINLVNTEDYRYEFISNTGGASGYIVYDDATKAYGALAYYPNQWYGALYRWTNTGSQTVRVYLYASLANAIGLSKQLVGQTAQVRSISGSVNERLELFYLYEQDINGALDLSFLDNCHYSLRTLYMPYSNITSITNTWLTNRFGSGGWRALKEIYLNDNNMSAAAVDNFINDFEAYSDYLYGGILFLKGNGGRTSASDTAVTNLTAKGWSVVV